MLLEEQMLLRSEVKQYFPFLVLERYICIMYNVKYLGTFSLWENTLLSSGSAREGDTNGTDCEIPTTWYKTRGQRCAFSIHNLIYRKCLLIVSTMSTPILCNSQCLYIFREYQSTTTDYSHVKPEMFVWHVKCSFCLSGDGLHFIIVFLIVIHP